MTEKVVVPYAPILVESTRSVGYSFESALADVIDNSVSAMASRIDIHFASVDPQFLCVVDNGWGMTANELEDAMRYGSKSCREKRSKDDLGRFGLGLKMASMSQCRKVTVVTKKDEVLSAACWDLDYILNQSNWSLKVFSNEEIQCIRGSEYLDYVPNGTVVVWENFDLILQRSSNPAKAFDEKIDLARKHLSLVFHRYLSGEYQGRKLTISFNGETVTGVDPFLTSHPATQPLSEQILRIQSDVIRIKPYVLPFLNKLSKKQMEMLGGKDELRQQQGFYIYRNGRLIIWGTWFRLIRQNELGKLARVRVDIPNSLDSLWEIDIKKSTASLPHFIKKRLADIVTQTVGRSEKVYKYRGRNVQTDQLIHVWNPVMERGRLQYCINKELPLINMVENHLDEEGLSLFSSLLKMMEATFPYADVYYRMAKSHSGITEITMEEQEILPVAIQMVEQIRAVNGDVSEILKSIDKMDFFAKYPGVIKRIREMYGND